MAVKIDLEKTYDRMRLEFIDASFQVAGIPNSLMNVIMSAIANSTIHVLWNEVPIQKFRSVRRMAWT